MASFPANVYGGGCKRLRERLQTFAGTFAMLCVRDGQKLAPKSPVLFWIGEKGRKGSHMGHWFSQGICFNRFYVGPCMIYDKCGNKQTKVAPCANNLRL